MNYYCDTHAHTHTDRLTHTRPQRKRWAEGVGVMQMKHNTVACFHLAPGSVVPPLPPLPPLPPHPPLVPGLHSGGRGGVCLGPRLRVLLLFSTQARARSRTRCLSSRPSSRRRRNCTPRSLREGGERGSCELSSGSGFILPDL